MIVRGSESTSDAWPCGSTVLNVGSTIAVSMKSARPRSESRRWSRRVSGSLSIARTSAM